jgi:hypothetical protein
MGCFRYVSMVYKWTQSDDSAKIQRTLLGTLGY